MGYLNFEDEKEHLNRIKNALTRRGLFMDESDEWEIHGPHQDMNYQVYIGYAYEKRQEKSIEFNLLKNNKELIDNYRKFYVAIYPRGVYSIGSHSKWWNTSPEDRIKVK